MIRVFLFALMAGLPATALSQEGAPADQTPPEHCPSGDYRREGGFTIQTMWSRRHRRCLLIMKSDRDDKSYPVYRTYSFGDNGLFMIFNSYGEGPPSRMTGARTYFMFPRTGHVSAHVMTTGEVAARTASGHEVRFSAERGRIAEITEAEFREDDAVRPDNEGGVEITFFSGLLLEMGYRRGGSPHGRPGRSSYFIDRHGNRCRVTNREIFSYDSSGDATVRFSDEELADYLENHRRRACRNLDVSVLRHASAAAVTAAGERVRNAVSNAQPAM